MFIFAGILCSVGLEAAWAECVLSPRVHPTAFCPGSAVSDNESGVGIAFVSLHLMCLSLAVSEVFYWLLVFRDGVRTGPGVLVFGVSELAGRVVGCTLTASRGLPAVASSRIVSFPRCPLCHGCSLLHIRPPRLFLSPLFPVTVELVSESVGSGLWFTMSLIFISDPVFPPVVSFQSFLSSRFLSIVCVFF